MRDNLGRYWKVDHSKRAFVQYEILNRHNGQVSILREVPELYDAEHTTVHVPRRGKCGGSVHGPKGFRLCSKCGAEVKR